MTTDVRSDWRGPQGRAWFFRNLKTRQELDNLYIGSYGVTRSRLNAEFVGGLAGLGCDGVLEVGCSNGQQLDLLKSLGFQRLVGVDLNMAALEDSREVVACADAASLPFPDRAFELVFTSGTLMHIPPEARQSVATEIARVARSWIWGFEPWRERVEEVEYGSLLNMPRSWPDDFPDCCYPEGWRLVRSRFLANRSFRMFLLGRADG